MKQRALLIIVGVLLVVGLVGLAVSRFRSSNTAAVAPTPQLKAEAPKPPEPVKLEIFSQEVFVKTPAASTEAAAVDGQQIVPGSQIRTGKGGRAQLVFPNHTVSRLDFNSQITLKKYEPAPQQVLIHLDLGRIWNRISKLFGQETYQTETNTAIATVRGTSYGMGIGANGESKITTFEGKVVAKPDDTCANTAEVNVATKQKTAINCKDAQPPKVLTIKDSDINKDEWLQFNKKEDKSLEERFGAQIFAHDNAESSVLGASTGGTPSVTPATLAKEPKISCTGPDGVVFSTTQKACDDLNSFWTAQKPTATPKQSPNTNPTSTPTPAPTTAVIAVVPKTPTPEDTKTPDSDKDLPTTNDTPAPPTEIPPSTDTPSTPNVPAPELPPEITDTDPEIMTGDISTTSNTQKVLSIKIRGRRLRSLNLSRIRVQLRSQSFAEVVAANSRFEATSLEVIENGDYIIAHFADIPGCDTYAVVVILPDKEKQLPRLIDMTAPPYCIVSSGF